MSSQERQRYDSIKKCFVNKIILLNKRRPNIFFSNINGYIVSSEITGEHAGVPLITCHQQAQLMPGAGPAPAYVYCFKRSLCFLAPAGRPILLHGAGFFISTVMRVLSQLKKFRSLILKKCMSVGPL